MTRRGPQVGGPPTRPGKDASVGVKPIIPSQVAKYQRSHARPTGGSGGLRHLPQNVLLVSMLKRRRCFGMFV